MTGYMADTKWIFVYLYGSLLCLGPVDSAIHPLKPGNSHPENVSTNGNRFRPLPVLETLTEPATSSRPVHLEYRTAEHEQTRVKAPKSFTMPRSETALKEIREIGPDTTKYLEGGKGRLSVNTPAKNKYGIGRSEIKPTCISSGLYEDASLFDSRHRGLYPCGPNNSCTCGFRNNELKANCSYRRLDEFPDSLPANVMLADISNNNISHLDLNNIVKYKCLKELKLSYNWITTLSFHDGSESTLESLDLSHNPLKDLSNLQFKALSNLVKLYLAVNHIIYIGPTVFSGMNKLQYLDLSRNEIKSIHPQAFDSLTALRSLKLNGNRQSGYGNQMLPPRLFEKLTNLESLWIQGNTDNNSSNEFYPNEALAKLLNLKSLAIDGLSGGREFGPQMETLTNLEELVFGHLGNCSINNISSSFFQYIHRIKNLQFFGCDVQNIDQNAFKRLRYLKNYTVAFPKIDACGFRNAFQSLKGLQKSPLQSLGFAGFNRGNGQCLTLSSSHAQYITNLTLKYLYLNFDGISTIDQAFLQGLPKSILRVHLRGNRFTFADRGWNYLTNMTQLDVREQNIYSSEAEDEDSHWTSDMSTYYKSFNVLDRFYSSVPPDLQDTHNYFSTRSKHENISPCVNNANHCLFKAGQTALEDGKTIPKTERITKNILHDNQQCDPTREICIPPKLYVLRASGFTQFGSEILFKKLYANEICYLDFSRGFLKNWGNGLLPGKVETADFSDNFCNTLRPEFFPLKNTLQHLCIQNNQLGPVLAKDINGTLFSSLRQLRYLNVGMNNIYKLPRLIFRGLKNLTALDMAENKLQVLDLNFTLTPALRFIDLSKNAISWITKESRQELDDLGKDHNISIDLRNNPLPCTCYGIEVLEWLIQSKVTILNKEMMQCVNESKQLVSMWPITERLQSLKHDCKTYSLLSYIIGSTFILLVVIIAGGFLYIYRWKLFYAAQVHFIRKYGYKPPDARSSQHCYDAFVVYCEEDRAFALDTLIEELEIKREHKLCLEDRDFIPGSLSFHNVPCAIQNSTTTLLLLSPDFIHSSESRYATQMALLEEYSSERNRGTILLLRYKEIPETELTKDLLMLMKKGRLMDYPNDGDETSVQRLWDQLSFEIGHTQNRNNRDIMLRSHENVR